MCAEHAPVVTWESEKQGIRLGEGHGYGILWETGIRRGKVRVSTEQRELRGGEGYTKQLSLVFTIWDVALLRRVDALIAPDCWRFLIFLSFFPRSNGARVNAGWHNMGKNKYEVHELRIACYPDLRIFSAIEYLGVLVRVNQCTTLACDGWMDVT